MKAATATTAFRTKVGQHAGLATTFCVPMTTTKGASDVASGSQGHRMKATSNKGSAMKTFITQNQLEALQAEFGPKIEPILASIDIAVSQPCSDAMHNGPDCMSLHDITSMMRVVGYHPALVFAIADVLSPTNGRPWLTEGQAEYVAEAAARWFEYGESGCYIDGALRHFDLPIDAPPGWFEWTDDCGQYRDHHWDSWSDDDAVIASCHGWKLYGLPAMPTIVRTDGTFESDEEASRWVHDVARAWRERDGEEHDCGRTCARAIALLAHAADQRKAAS